MNLLIDSMHILEPLWIYALMELQFRPHLFHFLIQVVGAFLEGRGELRILLRAFSARVHLRQVRAGIRITVLAALQRQLVCLFVVLLDNILQATQIDTRQIEAGLVRVIHVASLPQVLGTRVDLGGPILLFDVVLGCSQDTGVQTSILVIQFAALRQVLVRRRYVFLATFTCVKKEKVISKIIGLGQYLQSNFIFKIV